MWVCQRRNVLAPGVSTFSVSDSDLDVVAWCYMLPFPPGTTQLPVPAPGKPWRVSSAGKGATPVDGTKAPLRAPPAPLWEVRTQWEKRFCKKKKGRKRKTSQKLCSVWFITEQQKLKIKKRLLSFMATAETVQQNWAGRNFQFCSLLNNKSLHNGSTLYWTA